MFHAAACCVFRTVFSTHRHQASTNPAHPVSVPIRHPSDKSFAVTSFETGNIFLRNVSLFETGELNAYVYDGGGSTDGNTLGQKARGGDDNDDHSRGWKASPVHSDIGITEAHERTA